MKKKRQKFYGFFPNVFILFVPYLYNGVTSIAFLNASHNWTGHLPCV